MFQPKFAAVDKEAHHLLVRDDFLQEPKATGGSLLKLTNVRLAVGPNALGGKHSCYDFSVMYVLPAARRSEGSGPVKQVLLLSPCRKGASQRSSNRPGHMPVGNGRAEMPVSAGCRQDPGFHALGHSAGHWAANQSSLGHFCFMGISGRAASGRWPCLWGECARQAAQLSRGS